MSNKLQNDHLIANVTQAVESVHTNEFLEFISQVGYFSVEKLKDAFLSFDENCIHDVNTKAIVNVARAKMCYLEGNYLAAIKIFNQVFDLIPQFETDEENEIYSFINYEYALYLFSLYDYDTSKKYFKKAKIQAQSQSLKSLIEYQLETINIKMEKGLNLAKIKNLSCLFKSNNILVMHALSLHRIGIFYREAQKYKKAEWYFLQTLKIAKKNNYKRLITNAHIALGFLALAQNKYKCSQIIFEFALKHVESKYQKTLIYENLALIEYNLGRYSKSIDQIKRAYDTSIKYNVLSRIIEESLFLGDVYDENIKDTQSAVYYYKKAYEFSITQLKFGMSYTGVRVRGVEVFVRYLMKLGKHEFLTPEIFYSFALGKSWKEITDIFHYNIIMFHRKQNKNINEILSDLNLNRNTFYSVQNRLKQHGYFFPDSRSRILDFASDRIIPGIQDYLKQKNITDWQLVNKAFQADILKFLYERYGYKKNNLAENLKLSYPAVLEKLKSINI